jgi:hypothetical protein
MRTQRFNSCNGLLVYFIERVQEDREMDFNVSSRYVLGCTYDVW